MTIFHNNLHVQVCTLVILKLKQTNVTSRNTDSPLNKKYLSHFLSKRALSTSFLESIFVRAMHNLSYAMLCHMASSYPL